MSRPAITRADVSYGVSEKRIEREREREKDVRFLLRRDNSDVDVEKKK